MLKQAINGKICLHGRSSCIGMKSKNDKQQELQKIDKVGNLSTPAKNRGYSDSTTKRVKMLKVK